MIRCTALEAQNRARNERPVALVFIRRGASSSDSLMRAVADAARSCRIDALALDADAKENAAFLEQLRVRFVPELLLFARGVVIERGGVRDGADAQDIFASALRGAWVEP